MGKSRMQARGVRIGVVIVYYALMLSSARPVVAQSAYGDLGGGTNQLDYYAETTPLYLWNDARVEAWIFGDPAGASVDQQQGGAYVDVYWSGDFCGDYSGYSNHWEVEGWQWYSIYQGYRDDFTVSGC